MLYWTRTLRLPSYLLSNFSCTGLCLAIYCYRYHLGTGACFKRLPATLADILTKQPNSHQYEKFCLIFYRGMISDGFLYVHGCELISEWLRIRSACMLLKIAWGRWSWISKCNWHKLNTITVIQRVHITINVVHKWWHQGYIIYHMSLLTWPFVESNLFVPAWSLTSEAT